MQCPSRSLSRQFYGVKAIWPDIDDLANGLRADALSFEVGGPLTAFEEASQKPTSSTRQLETNARITSNAFSGEWPWDA